MERYNYQSIVDVIKGDKDIDQVTKIGLCRIWTKKVINLIKRNFPDIQIEAREIDLEPGLQHTFLRVEKPGQKAYFLDGVGTTKYPPFIGFEDEAPKHLKNSHSDMINSYIDKKH